jgi:CRP-like cAMP-binding protein
MLHTSAFAVDQELIQALETQSTSIFCEEDRVLFRQGDNPAGLYILNKGEAVLTRRSAAGNEVTSVRAAAGWLLGLPGRIGNEPCSHTAVAYKGAEFSFVKGDDFANLLRSDARLPLLQAFAEEIACIRRAILQLGIHPVSDGLRRD